MLATFERIRPDGRRGKGGKAPYSFARVGKNAIGSDGGSSPGKGNSNSSMGGDGKETKRTMAGDVEKVAVFPEKKKSCSVCTWKKGTAPNRAEKKKGGRGDPLPSTRC